jgi:arginyl-tRNA synthetase
MAQSWLRTENCVCYHGFTLYQELQNQIIEHVREFLRRQYQLDVENIAVAPPPSVALGEYALSLAFELAKQLRKPPRKIAEEIVAGLGEVPGLEKFEVAGAGYINVRIERGAFAKALAAGPKPPEEGSGPKVLVEHTSINPNKAAHVGHLRNAILGDTFVRLLRSAGTHVDVQNYIDNTGVQVADVVVGFIRLEKKSKAEIQKLIQQPRFDYVCWDVYTRVSQWYEEDKANLQLRLDTLHAIEQGGNETAEIAELISTAVLHRHLETMLRLDIEYDFLPRESEILHLDFWESAFALLKEKGVVTQVTEGKNKCCWVMKRTSGTEVAEDEENQKVIVRSNGTVTYVGKDIAYHLWKFGLLGRDFGYKKFFQYPDDHEVWISAEKGEAQHPHFGGVTAIYNVIDSRQADPQNNVVEAIRSLGYEEQAQHFHHFSYAMMVLTPRCAAELGYQLSAEDEQKSFIGMSGRKGFGVKADDLIDTLIAASRKEVESRHPELGADECNAIATTIAIGALRYFMLKYTKASIIAFDMKDALSFTGETGAYIQNAVVRASSIFRKGDIDPEKALKEEVDYGRFLARDEGNEFWELWLAASKLSFTVEQCIATTEPAYLAKYAFQLAQPFHNFYHKHYVLSEPDEARKKFLIATTAVVRRELIRALGLMGIAAPELM